MRKIDLGQSISVLANIGVIAGIVFLAVEVRQNGEAVRAQSRAQISSESAEHLLRVAENSELASIRMRANALEDLSPLEQERLASLMQSQFRRWENMHYQYREGLYSEEEFGGNLQAWRFSLATPSYRQHWEQRRQQFSQEFRTLLDSLVLVE